MGTGNQERRQTTKRKRGAIMPCQAVRTIDGYRCNLCTVAWDRDDARPCAMLDEPEAVSIERPRPAPAHG
jgi:hypothetical protein